MDDRVNVDALFLGPKSENRKFFQDMADFLVSEHIHWRRDFHPEDGPAIAASTRLDPDFKTTLARCEEVLGKLTNKLKVGSVPWFSPRYLGHMNSDTLMVANLAYLATILYNPNNVAFESSVATTQLELEVGKQLALMLGYDAETAWGHVTADGSIANYEALWVARNLKSIPLSVKAVAPELVDGTDDWELLNLPTARILDLVDAAKHADVFDAVRERSVRGTGVRSGELGRLLVPQSKHYSWTKAADILGIGQDNLVSVPVGSNYRMRMEDLRATIDGLASQKIPVLGVVAVVGTTEEGAVDEVHRIAELRDEYESQGVSFYLHLDAAYGGYARTIFLDEYGEVIPFKEIAQKLDDHEVISKEIEGPDKDVYDAFAAMGESDSITVDPHKMGYVPYSAGAVVMKDRRILDLISYFAAYVFEAGGTDSPSLLGSYIMEGSKAGATAAAVWAAHELIPLNMTGYGRIIGRGIEGAIRLYHALDDAEPFEAGGKQFTVEPLVCPDFNIVCFAFNEIGNTSLEAMNDLNRRIYDRSSYVGGPLYADRFITSHTELDQDAYGDTPRLLAERLGIDEAEWEKVHSVFVLRSCVLTPWLTAETGYVEYWGSFTDAISGTLTQIAESS